MDSLTIIILAGFVSIFILLISYIFVTHNDMNKLITVYCGGDDDLQKTFILIKTNDTGMELEKKYHEFSAIKRRASVNFHVGSTYRTPVNNIESLSTADIGKILNRDVIKSTPDIPPEYPQINIHPVDAFVVIDIGSVYCLDDANNNDYDEYIIELFIYYIAPTSGSETDSDKRLAVSLVSARGLSKGGRKNSMKFALDGEVVFLDKNEKFKTLFMNIRQDKSPTRTIEGGWTANIFFEEVEKK